MAENDHDQNPLETPMPDSVSETSEASGVSGPLKAIAAAEISAAREAPDPSKAMEAFETSPAMETPELLKANALNPKAAETRTAEASAEREKPEPLRASASKEKTVKGKASKAKSFKAETSKAETPKAKIPEEKAAKAKAPGPKAAKAKTSRAGASSAGRASLPPAFEGAFDMYLGHLRVERALSPLTLEAYGRDLDHFFGVVTAYGAAEPSMVTSDMVGAYLASLAGEGVLGPRSRARRLSAVKGFFGFLEIEGLIPANPAAVIVGPKKPKTLPKAWSKEMVEALVTAPDVSTALGLRDRAMLELAYAGGLRVSELLDLTIGRLRLDEGFARVLGKGSKERLVPVGEAAAQACAAWLARGRPLLATAKSPPNVFLNYLGGRMSRNYFWRRLGQIAAEAGLPELSPHVLRHSFATNLLEGGADLRAVQMMLGHESLATTEVYLKVEGSRLSDIHKRLHPRSGFSGR